MSRAEQRAEHALCDDCGTVLIRLCPCCELGDGGGHRQIDGGQTSRLPVIGSSDALGLIEALDAHENRKRRPSSEPPPIPKLRVAPKMSAFAKRLLELNHAKIGPTDAVDLTDEVLEDSEELGQDQIDDLFNQ